MTYKIKRSIDVDLDGELIRQPGTLLFPSLNNFCLFKTKRCLEDYLCIVKDRRHRLALTRFRLRSHNLAIETGRHNRIPRDQRVCSFCNSGKIEDEIHFLLFCSHYDDLRRPLVPIIQNLNTEEAFACLLNSIDPQVIRQVAKFIYLAFLRRA